MGTEIVKYNYTEGDINIDVLFTNKGKINATKVYKAFGIPQKTFADFVNGKLSDYANKLIEKGRFADSENPLSADNQVLIEDVIQVIKGGNNKEAQGTWLHPELALVFARWLSIDFDIFCDDVLKKLAKDRQKEQDENISIKSLPGVLGAFTSMMDVWKKKKKKNNVHVAPAMKHFMSLVNINTSEFHDSIKQASKIVGTSHRKEFYTKMQEEAYSMYLDGKMKMSVWAEIESELRKFHDRLMNARYSSVVKERDTILVTLKSVTEEKIEALDKLEEIKSQHKEVSTNPKYKITLRENSASEDMSKTNIFLKNLEGIEVLLAGHILKNDKSKNPRLPDFGIDFKDHSFGLYMNNGIPTINITKNKSGGYAKVASNIKLEYSDHLLHGYKVIGSFTYVVVMEVNSGASIIYKQDNYHV